MGRKGPRGEGNPRVVNDSNRHPRDSIAAAADPDAVGVDRLQVHLAFGEAEIAKLRQLCHQRGIDGDVVLRMLELEQELAGMGKRRGIRPRLRDLIDDLGGASSA